MAGLAAAGAARAQSAGAVAAAKPLQGKAAIVTAARNNQGRAYAIALARLGADVVLHFHRAETKEQNDETVRLVREQGARVTTVIGDMADVSVAKAVFDAAQNTFGKVDIVVNTVGYIVKKPFAQLTEADYVRSERANVKALFHVFQQSAQRLAENGRLIHIGTSLTAGSAPGYALYAGTKAPCEEFTRMVAREVGKRGITVNTIAPGPLDNTFFHAAETPESARFAANLAIVGRLGKEGDITPLVTFLAMPESQWVTGQTLWVNGGYLTR
ncbi:MAG: SDR family oxidoreductase [Burkholderiales bacterium]|jgi:NAD(P)-dependent dehydrogenase (short-subunit alcohol dehydrogenase family)|nr:SDR family oxidoreductase [Rhodocyclaceae bacterium]MCA3226695.1 SDR family oxidoreductase [Burkholderiales bacterium]MCA3077075.1 SDR family oxidoreductase [Rhodocyclaceae bacterium]MCA3091475.1 SDR family oxidoreductase [Rhodocyclaceae bacterium]MCA3095152.1 SDR family oxidoreductase [Rhodocyclaceae bacterium]